MAKTPGPPKTKTAAPAQFDMNSRDRKGGPGGGGGGRPGGPGGKRTEKRAPSQIITLPAVSVDRGEGWLIQKIAKIDQASHVAMGAEYRLTFEGHEPLVFEYLSAARDRSKEAPPELAKPEEAPAAEPAEEHTPDTEPADEEPAPDHPEPKAE